jgi:uncharacterized protein (TIGR02594 family)
MSPDIRWVQTRLKQLGYDLGPVDGIRGPRTDAAIVAFKQSIGFRPRPYLGPLTMAALEFHAAEPPKRLPWLDVFERVRGQHEVRNNRTLRDFLRSDGRGLGDPAKLPWCGDLVETCIRLALPHEPFVGPLGENPYWARNWLHFGNPLKTPMTGCVGVWARGKGGHVGFIVGEDSTSWYVDGGNQQNLANRTRISKTRRKLLGACWPITYGQEPTPLHIMNAGHLRLSTNEA